MSNKFMVLDIQRFADGGGDGAGTGEGAAVAQQQTGGDGVVNTAGSNASDAGEQNGQPQIDLSSYTEKEVEELIDKNPVLKKAFGKRTNGIVGKRLAQERAKVQENRKTENDVLDKLMALHGVKNVKELKLKLGKTISDEFAIQNGVSNDIGDEMLDHRVKDIREERYRMRYEQEMRAERQLRQWQNEAEEVKGVYADFDLNTELENPDFVKLISVPNEQYRMPMRQIYELIHYDEMIKAAEKRVADAYSRSVNANLSRPSENGTGNQSAVSGANDVSKLTKKERADLAKRAAKGETITLR